MPIQLDFVVSAVVTLLLVVDPIGLLPVFLSVTRGLSPASRRDIALRSCLIAGGILIGVALFGNWLITQLGITLPAFRIAGGLLLFAVAFEMVLGWRAERQEKTAEQAIQEEHAWHIAAVPLAIPLMAGPGAITATLLIAGHVQGRPLATVMLIAIIVVISAICFVVYLIAHSTAKLLGATGNLVLSPLLGVVLAALAAQYVLDGLRTVFAP